MSSSPAIIRSAVVLPQPDGPTSTSSSRLRDLERQVLHGLEAVRVALRQLFRGRSRPPSAFQSSRHQAAHEVAAEQDVDDRASAATRAAPPPSARCTASRASRPCCSARPSPATCDGSVMMKTAKRKSFQIDVNCQIAATTNAGAESGRIDRPVGPQHPRAVHARRLHQLVRDRRVVVAEDQRRDRDAVDRRARRPAAGSRPGSARRRRAASAGSSPPGTG